MTAGAILIVGLAWAGAFTYVGLRYLSVLEDLGWDALQRQRAASLLTDEYEQEEYIEPGVYRADASTIVEQERRREEIRQFARRDPYAGIGAEIEELSRHG